MYAIGVSRKDRVLYVLASGPVTAQIEGWDIVVVGRLPEMTMITRVDAVGSRGTAYMLGGKIVTAAHVVGNVFTGAKYRVTVGGCPGAVKSFTNVKAVSDVEAVIRKAMEGRDVSGEVSYLDAAVVETSINCRPAGLAGDVQGFVGMNIAGSPNDKIGVSVSGSRLVGWLGSGKYVQVEKGDRVCKSGITTGLTCGVVLSTNTYMAVAYTGGLAVIADAIVVRGEGGPFSKPGDSGAPVYVRGLG